MRLRLGPFLGHAGHRFKPPLDQPADRRPREPDHPAADDIGGVVHPQVDAADSDQQRQDQPQTPMPAAVAWKCAPWSLAA